jgi:hypothetical protein
VLYGKIGSGEFAAAHELLKAAAVQGKVEYR